MRVCIDATPLLLRSAGVKNYVYYWIEALRREAGAGAIATFPVDGLSGSLDHERSHAGLGATAAGLGLLHFLNYSRLPADGFVPACDVFHASHQLRNPPRKSRLTTTVHDMTCWLMPELHPAGNVKGGVRFGEQVMRRADGLIAVSEHTRRDAVKILGLDERRIAVIYPGVSERFFEVTAEQAAAARRKYALGKLYALFVGTVEPRKNLGALLDAYERLKPDVRAEFDLVIAGPAGWADRATIARLESPPSGVRHAGYVPEADLPGLTAGAAMAVYPSFYEGFGFPVAQAMAAGVPVITSNVSSLPEVTGDAGLLVDPRSVAEIAAAMEKLMLSPSLGASLAANGRRRAQRYRWEECARQSWEFFGRLA
jgi:glycosyltransferase involved in cell wall biosynthesis